MKTFTPILLAGIIFITCAGQDAASAVEQSEGSTIDQLMSGTFKPDEKWLYDNSGYILLGAIIEKASGQSYENFIRTKIFEPVGMKHSCYDRTEMIIPRRVKGYERTPSGFENAPYLSMTQPYAAGSLASSVDDLALWNSALWSNKLLKPESLAKAHKPHVLKDRSGTGYGYGWEIGSYEGHRTIEHGGGIQGFATYTLSLPERKCRWIPRFRRSMLEFTNLRPTSF
jgi:CubicO group peptidase (beta-lactamase class C family)